MGDVRSLGNAFSILASLYVKDKKGATLLSKIYPKVLFSLYTTPKAHSICLYNIIIVHRLDDVIKNSTFIRQYGNVVENLKRYNVLVVIANIAGMNTTPPVKCNYKFFSSH